MEFEQDKDVASKSYVVKFEEGFGATVEDTPPLSQASKRIWRLVGIVGIVAAVIAVVWNQNENGLKTVDMNETPTIDEDNIEEQQGVADLVSGGNVSLPGLSVLFANDKENMFSKDEDLNNIEEWNRNSENSVSGPPSEPMVPNQKPTNFVGLLPEVLEQSSLTIPIAAEPSLPRQLEATNTYSKSMEKKASFLHHMKIRALGLSESESNDRFSTVVRDLMTSRSEDGRSGWVDQFDMVVDYKDGKPETQGEGCLHTAIAASAIAAATLRSGITDEDKTLFDSALRRLLIALQTHGWGNSKNGELQHPIRHPLVHDYWLYDDGQHEELRNSPMTHDAFGAIISACDRTVRSPNTHPATKSVATDLLIKWQNYLVHSEWRTHYAYVEGEFETRQLPDRDGLDFKYIVNKDGGPVMFKGKDSYTLSPPELYAFKAALKNAGISTQFSPWSVFANHIAEYARQNNWAHGLGEFGRKTVKSALEVLNIRKSYSIELGPHEINGELAIGYRRDMIDRVANLVGEVLKTKLDLVLVAIRANAALPSLIDLITAQVSKNIPLFVEMNEMINFVKLILAPFDALFGSDDVNGEALAFILTMIGLYAQPTSFVISYMTWSVQVCMENDALLAVILQPFAFILFDKIRANGNPNGLLGWLAGLSSVVDEQVDLFEANAHDRWSKFAYGSQPFNEWKNEPAKLNLESPRIDYLAIKAHRDIGSPTSPTNLFAEPIGWFEKIEDILQTFLSKLEHEFQEFGRVIIETLEENGEKLIKTFENNGDAIIENINKAGVLYRRNIKQANDVLQVEVFDPINGAFTSLDRFNEAGKRIKHVFRKADGDIKRWIWGAGGVFETYSHWWRSTPTGYADGADMVESIIRESNGFIKQAMWHVGDGIKTIMEWSDSAINGGTKAKDLVKQLSREANGEMQRWFWEAGTGTFKSYHKWFLSSADGTAKSSDISISKVRQLATGALSRLEYNSGKVLRTLERWSKSTVTGSADAVDMIEKQLRKVGGELERTKWEDGIFKTYHKWYSSTKDGVANAADIAVSKVRDQTTTSITRINYHKGRILDTLVRWRKSTISGAAENIDIAESQLRSVDGQLERWRYNIGKIFEQYNKWRASTTDGAAEAKHLLISKWRTAIGELNKIEWLTNGHLHKSLKWAVSTTEGTAEGAHLVYAKVRDDLSQHLKLWRFKWDGSKRIFEQFNEWSKSTIGGGASGNDIIESVVRAADGQLRKWQYYAGKAFKSFNRWASSNLDGSAPAATHVIKQFRAPTSPHHFEQFKWNNGAITQYLKWKTSNAQAQVDKLMEHVRYNADGSRLREVWDDAENYFSTTWDKAGNVVKEVGKRLGFPQTWPSIDIKLPKW